MTNGYYAVYDSEKNTWHVKHKVLGPTYASFNNEKEANKYAYARMIEDQDKNSRSFIPHGFREND